MAPVASALADYESVLRRVMDKEGAALSQAARLREELQRTEEELQELRTLTRLMDRFAR